MRIRSHDDEVIVKALKRYLTTEKLSQTATEFGVGWTTIRYWAACAGVGLGHKHDDGKRIDWRKIRRMVLDLKE